MLSWFKHRVLPWGLLEAAALARCMPLEPFPLGVVPHDVRFVDIGFHHTPGLPGAIAVMATYGWSAVSTAPLARTSAVQRQLSYTLYTPCYKSTWSRDWCDTRCAHVVSSMQPCGERPALPQPISIAAPTGCMLQQVSAARSSEQILRAITVDDPSCHT